MSGTTRSTTLEDAAVEALSKLDTTHTVSNPRVSVDGDPTVRDGI